MHRPLLDSPSLTRRRRGIRLRAIVLAVALTAGAAPTWALSLGNAEVSSFLGQPLQMRVPVILDDPSDSTSQCPRIVPQASSEVPTLALGRTDLERGLTQTYLRITTPLPVDEPVLRVVLELGCTQRVRREFTLLLDPPAGVGAGAAPVVAAAPRIEFGRPEVSGVRGQPLLMTVPIQGEPVASLTSACVRSGRSDSAEMPRVLNDARVTLIERGTGRALRIHTPDAVNDARVRVLVEVGCDQPVRHEFVVLIDAPQLAATPVEATAPLPVAAPPKRIEKPVVAKPAAPPKPVAPPIAALPPPAAETPVTQKAPAPVAAAEPARTTPRETPARVDRLVLAAPEDTPRPVAPRAEDAAKDAAPRVDDAAKSNETGPDPTTAERTQVLQRLEVLAAEVKTLRAELDASAKRNRELTERARSASYAWAAAAGAALLLGIGILLGWRNRPRREEAAVDPDHAGPMTRILGKSTELAPAAPGSAARAMTEGAGPNTVAAIVAAHRAAHEQDTQTASTAIQVTEFRDTTQVIGELYSPYVDRSTTPPGPATRPGAAQPAPHDLDLGNERQTAFAPHTKTEIAVDIDLFERNSQIGRDLQREYERLDLVGREKAPTPPPPDPATQLGNTTIPLTTKLALDLDLDLPTITQPRSSKKDE